MELMTKLERETYLSNRTNRRKKFEMLVKKAAHVKITSGICKIGGCETGLDMMPCYKCKNFGLALADASPDHKLNQKGQR